MERPARSHDHGLWHRGSAAGEDGVDRDERQAREHDQYDDGPAVSVIERFGAAVAASFGGMYGSGESTRTASTGSRSHTIDGDRVPPRRDGTT
jgi:hypothetical protein